MTEDEAKTKWCPMAGPSRFSRQAEECLGSACMAWRPVPQTDDRVRTDKGELVSRAAADAFGWTVAQAGYCGLAGAPQ